MPHPAWHATACVLNGRLYVIGGVHSDKLQVLEMTEENGWSWSCKANLPNARDSAASVVHEGRIRVMGGSVDGRPAPAPRQGRITASVIDYDVEADAWHTAPPLPSACSECCATTIDGNIFLFSRVATFKHENAAWSVVEKPIASRATCRSVLLG